MHPEATCLPRHVAASLRPFLHDAAAEWTRRLRSNGTWHHPAADKEYIGRSSRRHNAACAQLAFERFVCSLPARVGDDELKPADWAFGAEPASVGKFVGHFALQLYLSTSVPARPYRHVLPEDVLRDWPWRPRQS